MSALNEAYKYPIIPKGYQHVEGKWYDGFVIERTKDGSQFVWVPVGFVKANGTLDGANFNERFGRRIWGNEQFSRAGYHEEITDELADQIKSVNKYGGFYFSRYNISKSPNGALQSKKNCQPWTNLRYYTTREMAATFETKRNLKSHLLYGAEYDTILEWLMMGKVDKTSIFDNVQKPIMKAKNLVTINSTKIGNHLNSENVSPRGIKQTGSREDWSINHIYDLAGNVYEMTQEQYGFLNYTIRGASYKMLGFVSPMTSRVYAKDDKIYDDVGFRIALYIGENANSFS